VGVRLSIREDLANVAPFRVKPECPFVLCPFYSEKLT
jgi:hypothetical protein